MALNTERYYAECHKQAHYAVCHYAECRCDHLTTCFLFHLKISVPNIPSKC
jgi:hypothetical protein